MRITFNEVAIKVTHRWTDADGKKRQQTKKFWQTVNPFNKAADGIPKSRDQIMNEIKIEAADWLARMKADAPKEEA